MTSEKNAASFFFFLHYSTSIPRKNILYYSVIKRTLNYKISKAKKTRFNWPSGQSWTFVKFAKTPVLDFIHLKR